MNIFKTDEIKSADNAYTNGDFERLTALITRAGESVCEYIPEGASEILIVSGTGNNGADGLAAAYYLKKIGYNPTVWILGRKPELNKTMTFFADKLAKENIGVNIITPVSDNGLILHILDDIKKSDVVIDAIFGTGFGGDLLPLFEIVINYINDYKKFTISVDIPSGVNGDTGSVLSTAIYADITVTFCNYKPGNILMPGKEYCGKVYVADIGMPSKLFETAAEKRISEKKFYQCFADNKADRTSVKQLIFNRNPYGHKGDFGKVLIIAGAEGMTGAAQLCAKAALRSGAGLVYIACPRKLLTIYETTVPEAVKIPLGTEESSFFTDEFTDELIKFSKNADVVLIGPGLGRKDETETFVRNFVKRSEKCSLIIDADALYAYRNDIETLKNDLESTDFVITPHDGEFSNLTGEPAPFKDRLTLARQLAYYLNGNVLLKGSSTIIANCTNGFTVNLTGNSGIATAGSGDVLAGIIAGIAASNNVSIYEAAYCGAYIHGLSGDIAADKLTEICVNATDIIENLANAYKRVIKDV